MTFTFPFDTCETPTSVYFAQPYSVAVNLCSSVIVFYYLCKTRTFHAFLLLFLLLLFDLTHTFSHFVHVQSKLQIKIVHSLAYFLNFALLYLFYKCTKVMPSYLFLGFLVLLTIFDIYAFFNLAMLYYLFTQIAFTFSLFLFYYSFLPTLMKNRLLLLFVLIGAVYAGFVNEVVNCKKMLQLFPNFPFHAIVELIILVAAYVFCLTFYNT